MSLYIYLTILLIKRLSLDIISSQTQSRRRNCNCVNSRFVNVCVPDGRMDDKRLGRILCVYTVLTSV